MRKLFCLLLVLVCIGSAALAATVPSKTTADLNTTTKITTESGETVDSLVIIPIADAGESKAAYEQKLAVCNSELKKLAVFENDKTVLEQLRKIKKNNKERFAKYVKNKSGIILNTSAR